MSKKFKLKYVLWMIGIIFVLNFAVLGVEGFISVMKDDGVDSSNSPKEPYATQEEIDDYIQWINEHMDHIEEKQNYLYNNTTLSMSQQSHGLSDISAAITTAQNKSVPNDVRMKGIHRMYLTGIDSLSKVIDMEQESLINNTTFPQEGWEEMEQYTSKMTEIKEALEKLKR